MKARIHPPMQEYLAWVMLSNKVSIFNLPHDIVRWCTTLVPRHNTGEPAVFDQIVEDIYRRHNESST